MKQSMGKRVAVYVIGVFVLALGVFLNVKCGLGISTTNSVPNVVSLAGQMNGMSWLTLGWACNIVYVLDMVFQCIVYREIRLKVILQFPFSFVFGRIVDLYGLVYGMVVAAGTELPIPVRTAFLVLSIILTSVGVCMVVNMDFVPNPPDGGVQALASLTKLPFGRAKWLWDGILLVITVVVSALIGVAIIDPKNIFIGTVLAFFTIGNLIFWINNHFGDWFKSIYDKDAAGPTPQKAA